MQMRNFIQGEVEKTKEMGLQKRRLSQNKADIKKSYRSLLLCKGI